MIMNLLNERKLTASSEHVGGGFKKSSSLRFELAQKDRNQLIFTQPNEPV